MKRRALHETLRLITKAQLDPRVRPDQGDQLQRAKRELEAMARSGKFDKERAFRAVEIVATVFLETLSNRQA